MTIFRKTSTVQNRKKSVEVKFRIEEASEFERKVSKKISEIKETFSHSSSPSDTKDSNFIIHEDRVFEPIDISINLCDQILYDTMKEGRN